MSYADVVHSINADVMGEGVVTEFHSVLKLSGSYVLIYAMFSQNEQHCPCLGGRMVKAPDRVTDLPVPRVRNPSWANARE